MWTECIISIHAIQITIITANLWLSAAYYLYLKNIIKICSSFFSIVRSTLCQQIIKLLF